MSDIEWLGVDVGWVYPAVDSDGVMYEWPDQRARTSRAIHVPAGPVTIRQPNGSVIVQDALEPAALDVVATEARHRRRVETIAASIVASAQRTGRGIALEDWTGFQQRKKAWVRVYAAIANRADVRRCPVVQVNRAYTSITCPECDRKTRANRHDRNTFACVDCGLVGQADHIAAINIARKAAGTFNLHDGRCSNPACSDVAWRASLCIWCYRFKYRKGRLPLAADFLERDKKPSERAYRDNMRRRSLEERRERRDQTTRERMQESYRTHDAWGNPGQGA